MAPSTLNQPGATTRECMCALLPIHLVKATTRRCWELLVTFTPTRPVMPWTSQIYLQNGFLLLPPSESYHSNLYEPGELHGRGFSGPALPCSGNSAHQLHLDLGQRTDAVPHQPHRGQTHWWWVSIERHVMFFTWFLIQVVLAGNWKASLEGNFIYTYKNCMLIHSMWLMSCCPLVMRRGWNSAHFQRAAEWYWRILLHCWEQSRATSETDHPHRHGYVYIHPVTVTIEL